MKIIIHPDVEIWNFEMDSLVDRGDAKSIALNRYCGRWQMALRKKFKYSSLSPVLLFNSTLISILKNLKDGDCVVVCDYSLPCIYHAIRRCCSNSVRVYYWLWNPTSDDIFFERKKNIIERLDVQICTFDSEDADKYNLKLFDQFFPIKKFLDEKGDTPDCDFYFLGCAKDRKDTINEIEEELSKHFKTKFIIPSNFSDYITYKENIHNCKTAKCIIDVVQGTQTGLTLRPLEALALRKKLLTNNMLIKQMPFYSPENIFIWGDDDISKIGKFLETPYNLSVEKFIDRYDVNTWIDSF